MSIHISVVIPCFNAGSFIAACLKSVQQQKYANIEIICVDDGSQDHTKQEIENFKSVSTIELRLVNQANLGAGAARNIGLAHSKGEYIQFLDADDLLKPAKLSHQAGLISSAALPPDFIAADYILKPSGTEVETVVRSHEKRPYFALLSKNLGITSANLWKRTSLINAGGFDKKLKSSQEYDLMFRLLKMNAKVLFDEEPLTIKCEQNLNSISEKNKRENRLRFIELQLRILDFLKAGPNLDEALENYFYHNLLYEIRLLHDEDQQKSYELYQELIPASFKPGDFPGISKQYAMAYRYLGYQRAQYIYKIYNRFFRRRRSPGR